DRARRDLAFHVERAPSPYLAVAQLARPGVDAPFRRIGEHRVRVRKEEETWALAAAGDPRDEVRPAGHLRVELAVDAARLEVLAQELRSRSLVAGRVDGVEPDQSLEELGHLLAER